LIAPVNQTDSPKDFADRATDHGKKIAIGEPRTVPAGHYAMQTLKALKLDQSLAGRLVFGESVRQVLSYVEQGQVYAGIVYSTDARQAGDKVKVIATADSSSHDLIEYPAAIVSGAAHHDDARKFLGYLSTEPAKTIFISHGFSIPPSKPATTRPSP
jgi:molybdate transport system substrate-binding protein